MDRHGHQQRQRANAHRPEAKIQFLKTQQMTCCEHKRINKTRRTGGCRVAGIVDIRLTVCHLSGVLKVDIYVIQRHQEVAASAHQSTDDIDYENPRSDKAEQCPNRMLALKTRKQI